MERQQQKRACLVLPEPLRRRAPPPVPRVPLATIRPRRNPTHVSHVPLATTNPRAAQLSARPRPTDPSLRRQARPTPLPVQLAHTAPPGPARCAPTAQRAHGVPAEPSHVPPATAAPSPAPALPRVRRVTQANTRTLGHQLARAARGARTLCLARQDVATARPESIPRLVNRRGESKTFRPRPERA